jgi:hypothetical protein
VHSKPWRTRVFVFCVLLDAPSYHALFLLLLPAMEGPPPARAPLGRPTLLTDLPGDVLAYILSFIPFEERGYTGGGGYGIVASRFVAAAACTALAAAARPPSAAWTDVAIPGRLTADSSSLQAASVAAQNALRDAMARAAPSVRHLSIRCPNLPVSQAIIVAMAAPAAPFLEELKLDIRNEHIFSLVDPILAAATRLTRLEIKKFCFEGPPPMITAGRAAIRAFRNDVRIDANGPSANYFDSLLALLRSLSATVAPGVGVEPLVLMRLDGLWSIPWLRREQAGFVRELTSVFGRHLTRLAVWGGMKAEDRGQLRDPETPAEAGTAVARLLENRALHALRELVIHWLWFFDPRLDLAAVHAPPPGLTFLPMNVRDAADVLLSPAIRAGLASLAIPCLANFIGPLLCLRGAGGSFGRLTRLVYGTSVVLGLEDGININLAPWGRPEFSDPTLVEMEAIGGRVTLNELGWRDRGSWCEGFLASLPRLARLVLRAYAYDGPFRDSENGLMKAAAVEDVVTTRLPRAARESGRRLDVAVHQAVGDLEARYGLCVVSHRWNGLDLAFEARPPA